MCKKCCKIVSKNYRFEHLGKKQACFSCADEHGVKLTRMDDEDSVTSRSRASSSSSSKCMDACTSCLVSAPGCD